MRSVIDNTGVTAGTTLAMLTAMQPFARADMLTFQLTSGAVLRFTGWDWPITNAAGSVYSNSGPQFLRDTVKHKKGVEVDDMTLQVIATDSMIVQGTNGWASAAREGVFDGALFSLDIAFFALPMANTGNAPKPTGFMNWFSGYVDSVRNVDPPLIEFDIKNDLGRLIVQMPRNYYQSACNNLLFDAGCGLNRASYANAGTVTAVNADGSVNTSLGVFAAAYFAGGSLYWTGGANAGLGRSIKNSVTSGSNTTLAFYQPLPQPIAVGDAFTAYPGCDKTQAACTAFGNTIHFRGTPFVPNPEVAL